MFAISSGALTAPDGALAQEIYQSKIGAGCDSISQLSPEQANTRLLSQWLDRPIHEKITDYNANEDELVLVYDPLRHPKPLVEIIYSQTGPWANVLIDGHDVARVNTPLTLTDIRLLPI